MTWHHMNSLQSGGLKHQLKKSGTKYITLMYWSQWWKGVIQVVMSWGAESLAKRLDTKVSQVQLEI